MGMKELRLYGTTNASGDLTVNGERAAFGLLYAVQWIDGDLADGVDATFTCQNTDSGVAQTLLTLTNANSDAWYYPRFQEHDNAGSTISAQYGYAILNGTLRMVISSGGNAKAGGAIVYWLE